MHTLRVYRPLQSRGQCGSSPTTQKSWPCSRRPPRSSQQSRSVGLPALILRGLCSRLIAGVAASPRRVRRLRGLGLRRLFGFRPVFPCNYRSHLVLMIAKKIRTKLEKVAPGSALHSGCPRLCGPRRVRRLGGLGLRSLLGSCPVFLCSYCSHFGLDDCKEDPDEIREGDVRFCSGAWVACSGVIGSEWSFPRASSQPLWVRRPF